MFFVEGCVPSNNNRSELIATLAPQEAPSAPGGCFSVAGWAERINHTGGGDSYVPTSYHDDLLTKLLQSHTAGDFCLIGGRVRVWGEGGGRG